MNSLPFSLGIHIPTEHCTLNHPLNYSKKYPFSQFKKFSISSSVKDSEERRRPILSSLLRRRETLSLGLGLTVTVLDTLLQPQSNTEAIAAEEAGCEFTETPSGLGYCDKVVGNGPEVVKGLLIKAHYVGKLENGTVFDSSYSRGKPLTFRVGVGEVIKGWDQGILGGDGFPPMLTGGKRKLKIPPELGYGARGAGCRGGTCIIPPNAVLLFDVEFVGKA